MHNELDSVTQHIIELLEDAISTLKCRQVDVPVTSDSPPGRGKSKGRGKGATGSTGGVGIPQAEQSTVKYGDQRVVAGTMMIPNDETTPLPLDTRITILGPDPIGAGFEVCARRPGSVRPTRHFFGRSRIKNQTRLVSRA